MAESLENGVKYEVNLNNNYQTGVLQGMVQASGMSSIADIL